MWVEEEILILPFYMYLDSALSGMQKVVQARKCTVLGSTKCVHCKGIEMEAKRIMILYSIGGPICKYTSIVGRRNTEAVMCPESIQLLVV